MWTGRAAHNTNVTDVFPPYGTCYNIVTPEYEYALTLSKAGILRYFKRVSTRTIYPPGYNLLDTIPTIPANFGTAIPSTTMTSPRQVRGSKI